MHNKFVKALLIIILCNSFNVVNAQNLEGYSNNADADWGVWIDDGLVDPGETVSIKVTIPPDATKDQLPSFVTIHPRYLEEREAKTEKIPLKWKKAIRIDKWQALITYKPKSPGNYYASVNYNSRELFSYFAAWKPGLTAVNFWMSIPAEYHDTNALKDLLLPEVKQGHLPIDYELFLVGEKVFSKNWETRKLFRQAQVECGSEVIPFLDGGYFHKLDTSLRDRFNNVQTKLGGYEQSVSAETKAVHGLYKLPDPTFHALTEEQSSAVIIGAQRYWKAWGFRPFTGISTYSPSTALVESCRKFGLKWISGVFADYDFTDGSERWEVGWRQRHRGMPSFPYLISKADYRWTGKADQQSTMMFPGWQNLPVWDHEDKHGYGTDITSFKGYSGMTPLERMMLFSEVFERNDRLADNKFPVAETFCVQMDNPKNGAMLTGLADRARQGKLIFIHKRHLQAYYKRHNIIADPDFCYTIPDAEIASGRPMDYHFTDETVWEGSEGKAAFISQETAPLPDGRSIYTPVWWYDYRNAKPLTPDVNLSKVDLSGLEVKISEVNGIKSVIVKSVKSFDKLPICLWGKAVNYKPSSAWIKKYNALKVAAPKQYGENAITWIIRPVIDRNETVIPLM